jgi:hypothetical protein
MHEAALAGSLAPGIRERFLYSRPIAEKDLPNGIRVVLAGEITVNGKASRPEALFDRVD